MLLKCEASSHSVLLSSFFSPLFSWCPCLFCICDPLLLARLYPVVPGTPVVLPSLVSSSLTMREEDRVGVEGETLNCGS